MLYDIDLEVALAPEGKRETIISRTNYAKMYYSAAQQLCHHTTSGCPMRVGDLLGSGTISGEEKESRGSLLELSWGGQDPLTLDTGEAPEFLLTADGQQVDVSGLGAESGEAPAARLWAAGAFTKTPGRPGTGRKESGRGEHDHRRDGGQPVPGWRKN